MKTNQTRKPNNKMKIYKIYQTVNDNYDTYDSAVVCTENEEDAKKISPDRFEEETPIDLEYSFSNRWCSIKDVKVEYIGEADKSIDRGIIVSSFNAG